MESNSLYATSIDMAVFCANDGSSVLSASCRTFDFSQHFEDSVLSVFPQVLFLVWAIAASVLSLYAVPCVKVVSNTLVAKAILAFALIASQAALLVGAVRLKDAVPDPSLWLASNALSLLASLSLVPAFYLFHVRSRKPSMVITSYLIIIVLCDAARIRTAYLTNLGSTVFANALISSLVVKVALILAENIEKNGILLDDFKGTAHSFETANTFRNLLLFPLLYVFFSARKRVLTLDDLEPVGASFETQDCRDRLMRAWNANGRKSILRALVRAFWINVLAQIFPKLVYIACLLAQPWLLFRIINFLDSYSGGSSAPTPAYVGWGIVAAFIVIYLLIALSNARYRMASVELSTKFRAAVIGSVYVKLLESSTVGGRKDIKVDISAATTLMSVDVERCALASLYIPEIWGAFVIVGFTLYFLYTQMKLGMLGAFGVVLFTFLSTPKVSAWAKVNQAAFMKANGVRVKLTTFLVDNMLAVKMSGLLPALEAEAIELRRKELTAMIAFWNRMRWAVTLGGSATMSIAFWVLVIYSSISIHHPESYPPLDVSRLFTAFSFISLLTGPLNDATQGLPLVVAAYASLLRLQYFLASPHVIEPPPSNEKVGRDDTEALFSVHNAGFHYTTLEDPSVTVSTPKDKSPDNGGVGPFLQLDSLTLPAHQLVLVFGKVGSGKSVLLKSILGETWSTKPIQHLANTPYCPQDPWMLSATVKDNIVLYRAFDEEWYSKVLEACLLVNDLARLENGDETLLTSNGLALSGGMRHRVALARALYGRAEQYVLDDIFSALDTTTTEHIFKALFGSKDALLYGKSVVLATHAVHLAPFAGFVVILDEGRVISAQTPLESKDLWERLQKEVPAPTPADADVADLVMRDTPVQGNGSASKEEKEARSLQTSTGARAKPSNAPEVTVDARIALKLLAFYARNSGVYNFVWVVLLQTLNAAVFSTLSIYLNFFAVADNGLSNSKDGGYLGGLGVLWVGSLVLYLAAYSFRSNVVIPVGGMAFHRQLLQSVGTAPLSWFTTISSGQIVNRFSQDLFAVDFEFTPSITGTIFQMVSIIVTSAVAVAANYYLAPLLVALAVVFVLLNRFYMKASRQIRRLDSAAKSPLYSLIGDSVNGLHVIRAFGAENTLLHRCDGMIDISQRAYFARFATQQWLTLVLDFMAASVAILLAILAVALRRSQSIGLLAVALSNLINTSRQLDSLMRTWTETENGMVALERIREYTMLESEEQPSAARSADGISLIAPLGDTKMVAEKDITDGSESIDEKKNKSEASSSTLTTHSAGCAITFKDVVVRYNSNSKPALQSVSFFIEAGSTLGIAGRSGSGKSSLLLTLLGFIQIESGSVILGGYPTKEMSLATLRSHFSVLSQDPLCPPFSIRRNLDPTGKCDDAELWDILKRVQLDGTVGKLEGKLDFVLDGKESLSRGQKQLLCLGRVILERRPVVLVDEGTSSMDEETQSVVKKVLKESLAHKTVISIAHRTSTILDCDKILVMDAGKVVEFGSPTDLLGSESGAFKAFHEGG